LLNDRQREGFASSALTVAEADVMGVARIRSQYRVRMPDAVALHLAITSTSELATFDDALAGAARLAGVVVVD